MQHSPGPWKVYQNHKDPLAPPNIIIESGARRDICGSRILPDAQDQANFRLIAAAPDMKEAITDLLRYWDKNSHMTVQLEKVEDHIWKLRKALALAEGKEPQS